jgi:hypothetical protein
MAQRYGGEGYIRAPVKRQPQRPVNTKQTSRGPNNELLVTPGVYSPESGFYDLGNVPYQPFEMSTSRSGGITRGDKSDAQKSSEIQAARARFRRLKEEDPAKFKTILRGNTFNVSEMDKAMIKLLNMRDPLEPPEAYTEWNAERADLGRKPPRKAKEPGYPYKEKAAEAFEAAKGLVGQMGDTPPQNVSDLRRALEESGALTPQ